MDVCPGKAFFYWLSATQFGFSHFDKMDVYTEWNPSTLHSRLNWMKFTASAGFYLLSVINLLAQRKINRIILIGSIKRYQACLSIYHWYFPSFKIHVVERISSLRLEAIFLRLEILRGTTIAAEIRQAVVDLKLEIK